MAIRLAIIATHPIQYYSPVFRMLGEQEAIELHVFYNWEGATRAAYDPGFDRWITWDIPMLEGYDHTFVPNVSKKPGTHHYGGLDNPGLVSCIESWKPDAVLVIGWNYKSHLRALRVFHNRYPVFFRGDSTMLNTKPGYKRLVRRVVLTTVYRYVDVALYVGTHNKNYFKVHGLCDDQLVWAPHAIDNDRFYDRDGSQERAASAWRSELGIPQNAMVYLFAGKLEPVKDPELLLKAVLATGHSNVHLIFVGSGPLESKMIHMAKSHDQVHFLGFQNQSKMPVVYRLGDMIVLPSLQETWGLAINEAMACSRPVIVSDRVGCAPDLVKEESNGYVFPAGDFEALKVLLDRVYSNRGQLEEMGKRSLDLISSWSIEAQVECIVEAVKKRVVQT